MFINENNLKKKNKLNGKQTERNSDLSIQMFPITQKSRQMMEGLVATVKNKKVVNIWNECA